MNGDGLSDAVYANDGVNTSRISSGRLSFAPLLVMQGGDFSEGALLSVSTNQEFGDVLSVSIHDGSGSQVISFQPTENLGGTWHQAGYVIDREASLFQLYLDGQIVASEALTIGSIDPTQDLLIGQYRYSSARNGLPQHVGGTDLQIDNVKLFDGVANSGQLAGEVIPQTPSSLTGHLSYDADGQDEIDANDLSGELSTFAVSQAMQDSDPAGIPAVVVSEFNDTLHRQVVRWSPVTNVESYFSWTVDRATGEAVQAETTSDQRETSLPIDLALGDYRTFVSAINAHGSLGWSDAVEFNFAPQVNLPPEVIEPVVARNVLEDAESLIIDLNTILRDPEGKPLQFEIETSPAAGLAVATLNGSELKVNWVEHGFGDSSIVVRAKDELDQSALATIPLSVAAVNDAPFVSSPLGTVTLDHDTPSRTFDLTNVFTDVDDVSLTFTITEQPSSLASGSISGSLLTLTGAADQSGVTTLTVSASDAGDLSVSHSVSVSVDRSVTSPTDLVQYALAQDVLMQSQGSVIVDLQSNLNSVANITVESVDPTTIDPDDVDLIALGDGRIRVLIRHRTNDYGVTFLRLRADGKPLSEFAVLVTPPADRLNEDTGIPTLIGTASADGTGVSEQTRSVNSRWLASAVAKAQVDFATAMSIVRVADPLAAAVYLTSDSELMTYETSVEFVDQTSTLNFAADTNATPKEHSRSTWQRMQEDQRNIQVL